HRAQASTGKGRQVAIVVMGCHIELIDLGQVANLLGLTKTVPGHVNHEDVGSVALKVGDIVVHVVQVFTGADLGDGGLLDLQQGVGVVAVDLQPVHVVGLERLGNAHAGLGLEVEVEVQVEIEVRANGI